MRKLLLTLFAGACLCSCSAPATAPQGLVPYPNRIETASGEYDIRGAKVTCDKLADERTQQMICAFAQQLGKISGVESPVTITDAPASEGIRLVVDKTLAEEGYRMEVMSKGIELRAATFNGFMYGVQTLKQLLPEAIYGQTAAPEAKWTVGCMTIDDAPRYSYRGMHLDVSRHFFDVKEVKRYLDIMAVHKLNVMHWHLTDDQGWRIEIKRYPELTTIGSKRKGTVIYKQWGNYDNIPYGGYYTQDEVRDVVAYAHSLGITVIPEIDLPGHMMGVLAAYPELGCTGGPYEVWKTWGVSDDVLCVGNEKSFELIENVLKEVMELFPSKLIHIGGDECPKIRWTTCPKCQARIKALGLKGDDKHSKEHFLQSYVTERVGKFLSDHGRRAIGWDEILEGKAPVDAIVMSWRGSEGGIAAAKLGHDVIMTPNTHCYFDHYQSLDVDAEPFAIGGYLPVKQVYSFDGKFPELTDEERKHILGVQGNLWTEYVKTNEHLEYMLLPRLAALSEAQWCQPEVKNWDRFISNFRMHKIYDIMGYNYAKHIFGVTASSENNTEKGAVMMTLATLGNSPIHYTLDGSEPTAESPLYTEPVAITKSLTFKAKALREGIEMPAYEREFVFTKSTAHKAVLNSKPTEKYTYGGVAALVDGHHGYSGYSSGAWVGFLAEPLDMTIEMKGEEYSSVELEASVDKNDWIFAPRQIEVLTSDDGKEFKSVALLEIPMEEKGSDDGVKTYKVEFPATKAKFLRVVAQNCDLPEWHGGHGNKAHLFVDEVSVL